MPDSPQQADAHSAIAPGDALPSEAQPASAVRAALRILLPTGGRGGLMGSPAAVHWLVPGGLVIGLMYVGLFRASWRIFGEVAGVRLMPAVAVWLADVGLLGLAIILAASRTADRWSSPAPHTPGRAALGLGTAGTLVLVILLMLKLALWTAVPEGIEGWPADWRRHFNFLYPRPVFRPLILAPLWGRWALILAGGIGRAAPGELIPAGLGAGRSVLTTLGWFAAVLAVTAIFCGRHGQWMIGCLIGLAVLASTFLFAVVTARRFGGCTCLAVYSSAVVAELTFLLGYLAASQHIYRY